MDGTAVIRQRVVGVIPQNCDIKSFFTEVKNVSTEKVNEKNENKMKSEIRKKFITGFLLKAGFKKDEIKAIKNGISNEKDQAENPFKKDNDPKANDKKKAEAVLEFILGTACNLLNSASLGITGITWNGYQTLRAYNKLNKETKQARLEEVAKYFEEELAPIKEQIENQFKADQNMLLAEYTKHKEAKTIPEFTKWLTDTYIAGIFNKFNIKDMATKAQETAAKKAEGSNENTSSEPAEQHENSSQSEPATENIDAQTSQQHQEETKTKEEENRKAAEEASRKMAEEESEQGRVY